MGDPIGDLSSAVGMGVPIGAPLWGRVPLLGSEALLWGWMSSVGSRMSPIGVWGSTVGLDVPIGDLSCAIGAIGMGAPNGAEDVPYWGLLG